MRLGAFTLPLILALLTSGSAHGASTQDLAGFTNREYVDYARDRFEWLTGEARSSHTLAKKFHRVCDGATAAGGEDAGRACEIAKAADEQGEQVLKEGQDLMQGLEKRLGHVPTWARDADAALTAALRK